MHVRMGVVERPLAVVPRNPPSIEAGNKNVAFFERIDGQHLGRTLRKNLQ